MMFRKHFGYDVVKASDEATLEGNGISSGESMTLQSQSEDADINVMMKRFGLGQKMPENPRIPTFGDFSGVSDFRSAMESIVDAEEAFMEFPPNVRDKFKNSPQLMMEFCENAANWDEAKTLGILSDESIKARQEAAEAARLARQAQWLEAARSAGWKAPEEPGQVVQGGGTT